MDPANKILIKGKTLVLAYDQGFEHGAADFTDANADPEYVINIANKAKFSAIVLHKGLATKYRKSIKVPLIIKLNGKTNFINDEPLSTQLCSVSEAKKLKAIGVGYTIYLGSEHEQKMLAEFSKIEEEAHAAGMLVIAWMYPRGKSIATKTPRELISYAARVGLELGADFVKIPLMSSESDLAWAVKVAGKTKLIFAGGQKKEDSLLLKNVEEVISSGASGLAIGRNVWQHKEPLEISKKIKKIVFK